MYNSELKKLFENFESDEREEERMNERMKERKIKRIKKQSNG